MVYLNFEIGILGPMVTVLCSLGIYCSILLNEEVKALDAKRRKLLDKKSKIVSDSILSIKNIKFNGWEDILMTRLTNLRKNDNSLLMKNFTVQGISTTVISLIPSFIGLIIVFSLKVFLKKDIPVAKIYIILLYLNQVKKFFIYLNFGFIEFNSALISMKRIQCFLSINELKKEKKRKNNHKNESDGEEEERRSSEAVRITDASFRWTSEEYRSQLQDIQLESNEKNVQEEEADPEKRVEKSEFRMVADHCLKNINFSVEKGNFVCFIGQVGAGKSSLLKSLLGQLTKIQGELELNGSVGYIPQEAFLLNDTLRNNILLGREYDQQKYERIVKMSQLKPDFELLPHGDLTEIGERGLNLSGGQKQRVSIARALYSESDIYLVDDCLSALDSHVGGAILEQVFFDFLKEKTVLMTTHRYHFLDRVDEVFVLEDGQIVVGGPYEEVKKTRELQQLVQVKNKNDMKESQKKRIVLNDHEEVKEDQLSISKLSEHSSLEVESLIISGQDNLESRRGSIKLDVFKFYFSKGGLGLTSMVVLLFTLSTLFSIISDWWAGSWVSSLFLNLPNSVYGLIYVILIGCVSLTYISKFYLIGDLSRRSCFKIFQEMIWNILRSKMSFFDTTPSGVIMNRCIEDMEIVDYEYAMNIKDISESVFTFLGALVLTFVGSWLMIPIILPMMYFCGLYFLDYLKSSIELKRLYRTSRSSILNCVTEFMEGHTSIRAFSYTEKFEKKWQRAHNLSIQICFHEKMAKYILVVMLYVVTALIYLILCFIFYVYKAAGFNLIFGKNITSLILTNSFNISIMIYFISTKLGDVVNNTSVVERLQEYCVVDEKMKQRFEADFDKPELDQAWPTNGDVTITNLSLRYRESLPCVIRDLNLKIRGGEKVGVVGRTGSGKSTLLLGLTRILEVAINDKGELLGSIEFDNINIADMGLHLLRKNLTVIPQDPILLEGTLKSNIDPVGEYSDAQIIQILEIIKFRETLVFEEIFDIEEPTEQQILANSHQNLLNYEIEHRGSNLSLGQRQLVCIARALVQKPKILLMDEATASIDQKTDRVIQKIIKNNLEGTTVVTIAHRLDTIIQYDKILVLDNGCKVEEGTPSELLEKKGVFYGMVEEGGANFLQRMIYYSENREIEIEGGDDV